MFKKLMTIFISVMVCGVMFNSSLIFDAGSGAEAASSDLSDLENDFTMTTAGTAGLITAQGNKLTVGDGNSSDKVLSYVLTSKNTVDFSRSFTYSGKLTDTNAPDGFTITFQPNKDYSITDTAGGSGLCVYKQSADSAYAVKGLVSEVDSYDSAGYNLDGASLKAALAGHGWTSASATTPHMAITTPTDSSSEWESVKDAQTVNTGGSGNSAATYDVTVKWTVTDQATGYGTYTFTYGDKSVSYSFDPKDVFGGYEVYMSLTGSENFKIGGSYSRAPWSFETGTFSYAVRSSATATITAGVTVNGKTPSDLQKYDFVLTDADGNVLQTKQNDGAAVTFDPMNYGEAGQYTYYIQQKPGSEAGVTYDDSKYKAVVSVGGSHDILSAGVSYYKGDTLADQAAFANKAEPAKLVVRETDSSTARYAQGGQKIKYTIKITNKGKGDAAGVYVRRYMPDRTTFWSVDKAGYYGCIDQREHASWFVRKIPAGSSVTLTFTIEVDECHPDNYVIGHQVYWQLMNSYDKPYLNQTADPSNVAG